MQLEITPLESARLFRRVLHILGLSREPRTEDEALRLARAELFAFYDRHQIFDLMRASHALADRIGRHLHPVRGAMVSDADLSAAMGGAARARVVARLAECLSRGGYWLRRPGWIVGYDESDPQPVPFAGLKWCRRTGDFVAIN